MKAISRNLLSPLTEHNQTETLILGGCAHLVGDFVYFSFFLFFFCLQTFRKDKDKRYKVLRYANNIDLYESIYTKKEEEILGFGSCQTFFF